MSLRRPDYATVLEWDAKRTRELSGLLSPYLQVTDAYAELICEIVDIIGTEKPSSLQEIVVRDLLADVFDALHEARRIILTGKCGIAYTVARRGYESLSLMVTCVLDASIATKWAAGKKLQNEEIRQLLAKHPLGETEESTKNLYRFFSLGAHPNRDFIPHRFLGEGSEFTLGSVGDPSLALVTEYCAIHLRMWFWFAAILFHHEWKFVAASRPSFESRYLRVADEAQKLQVELDRNYDKLLVEEQAHHARTRDA